MEILCYHRSMREESELVPYLPGHLDGSPLLVLAPHPDDEVFGCGGVLALASRRGARIRTVILTGGGAQGDPGVRRAEAAEAARRLGIPAPEHWDLRDRSLDPSDPELCDRLEALIAETAPSIVLAPSPAEVHPDHRALALALYRLLQTVVPGTPVHEVAPALRLAAYEVSAVLRPNLLVDVGEVWEDVLAAAKAYESQVSRLPYVEVLEGVASMRRLTLPQSVRRAEAYHVCDLRWIRTHSAAEWAAEQGPTAGLEAVRGATPLDVVVRTASRPQLLREALESLAMQLAAPARVIVVDDGKVPASGVCRQFEERLPVEVVATGGGAGRSAAAQLGLERASASHVVFLDDDDRFFPEHLLMLGRAVASGIVMPYTDAIQGVWAPDGEGGLRPIARHRTFGGSFEPARFGLINHIPLPTVAMPRELALELGGFDRKLELYEDWDLLLRLAERARPEHLAVITCEYRIVEGSASITGGNPPGSPGQLAALAAVWERHGLLGDPPALAAGVMALVGERDRQAELVRSLDERLIGIVGERDGLRSELARVRTELPRLEGQLERTRAEAEASSAELARVTAESRSRMEELARLRAEHEVAVVELERLRALWHRWRGSVWGKVWWKLGGSRWGETDTVGGGEG